MESKGLNEQAKQARAKEGEKELEMICKQYQGGVETGVGGSWQAVGGGVCVLGEGVGAGRRV